MRSCSHGRRNVGVVEVEGPITGWWGIVDVNGGFAVELVNINGGVKFVDIDGTGGTSGWGISFGGYEERS